MRVLVSGGLGCIGSKIAESYLDAGHSVHIIDAAEERRNCWTWTQLSDRYGGKVTVQIARLEKCPINLDGIDQVIHAAASTGIPHSRLHPDDDWISNVEATRALLDALRRKPVPTVVLSSVKPYRVSSHQYDSWEGLTEDDPLEPDEPYGASKAAGSMLAMAWARSYGIPVVTFRCSNLYGPAPCHGKRHGWLTHFCISAALGNPIEVQGGGKQSRDMLFSSDVAAACRAALENAYELKGKVFNIGGGTRNVIGVGEAADLLHDLTGVQLTEGPGRADEDQFVCANYGRFKAATGWEPKVHVYEGIQLVLRWAQACREELREIYRWV